MSWSRPDGSPAPGYNAEPLWPYSVPWYINHVPAELLGFQKRMPERARLRRELGARKHRIVVLRPPVNSVPGHVAVREMLSLSQQAAGGLKDHIPQRLVLTSPVQSAGPSGPTHGKSVSPGPWATRLWTSCTHRCKVSRCPNGCIPRNSRNTLWGNFSSSFSYTLLSAITIFIHLPPWPQQSGRGGGVARGGGRRRSV